MSEDSVALAAFGEVREGRQVATSVATGIPADVFFAAMRFWSHVDKSAGPDACWPWLAHVDPKTGYGRARHRGRLDMAHRVAFELSGGVIPRGRVIDHVAARGCTKRSCVNPAHLEAVTRTENNRRGSSPSWVANRAGRCFQGHPFKRTRTGRNDCLVCAARRKRGYRAAAKRRREAGA